MPTPVDYNNDHDFRCDLPANFDVLNACYRQWLWSRDGDYLDEVFLNYCLHTVTDYVQAWDHDHDVLMGIRPPPFEQTIETFPQLTDETGRAVLHPAPVGRNVISVKHVRNDETALTNENGPSLVWRAAFPGKFRAPFSDGKQIPSTTTLRGEGSPETYRMVHVAQGETRVVRFASR